MTDRATTHALDFPSAGTGAKALQRYHYGGKRSV
jgi:hypothetical protein